jgi:hypothetical protein
MYKAISTTARAHSGSDGKHNRRPTGLGRTLAALCPLNDPDFKALMAALKKVDRPMPGKSVKAIKPKRSFVPGVSSPRSPADLEP